jgi:hypothetical protein
MKLKNNTQSYKKGKKNSNYKKKKRGSSPPKYTPPHPRLDYEIGQPDKKKNEENRYPIKEKKPLLAYKTCDLGHLNENIKYRKTTKLNTKQTKY